MRKPLIAGNWKMNLNHLEAIAVTQKLAYSLEDKDYDAVEIVVIPTNNFCCRSNYLSQASINDARAGVSHNIGRNYWIFCVS